MDQSGLCPTKPTPSIYVPYRGYVFSIFLNLLCVKLMRNLVLNLSFSIPRMYLLTLI